MARRSTEPTQALEDVPDHVRRGDPGGFRVLVEATSRDLVRLAARMLGDLQSAEDVVQESYVKAFRAMTNGSFDRRSSVRTWLYRITTNAAIDALRCRRPAMELVEEPPCDDAPGDVHVALREVSAWMGALPPEQRATLVLSAFEGRTNAEIAQILQCSEGAVEQRLVRARAALRRRTEV